MLTLNECLAFLSELQNPKSPLTGEQKEKIQSVYKHLCYYDDLRTEVADILDRQERLKNLSNLINGG